jgi:hypothetical protein
LLGFFLFATLFVFTHASSLPRVGLPTGDKLAHSTWEISIIAAGGTRRRIVWNSGGSVSDLNFWNQMELILNQLGMPGPDVVQRMRERRPGALFNERFAEYLLTL